MSETETASADVQSAQSAPSDYEVAMSTLRDVCASGDNEQRLEAAKTLLVATGYVR